MPYSDISELPPAVKKLPEVKQRQWMHVWTSAYNKCGGGKECESSAFAQAWGVVKSLYEDEYIIFEKDDIVDEEFVEFVTKSSAAINDLPDSAFAYIESGGTKDESGKTTPRSLRHFPIHDKSHVINALARMNQSPFGKNARAKIIIAAHKFGVKLDEKKWMKSTFIEKMTEFFEKMSNFFDKEGEYLTFGDKNPPNDEDTCKTCKKPVKSCVCKSDTLKDADFEYSFDIKKTVLEKGLVYGIVYEPKTKDLHDDFTSEEEIEHAAHEFLPNALKNGPAEWTDVNHKEPVTDVEIVESYIAPVDFRLDKEIVKKGSWVVVSRVNNPELRASIEKGEITGYSLEGRAKKIDIG